MGKSRQQRRQAQRRALKEARAVARAEDRRDLPLRVASDAPRASRAPHTTSLPSPSSCARCGVTLTAIDADGFCDIHGYIARQDRLAEEHRQESMRLVAEAMGLTRSAELRERRRRRLAQRSGA